MGSSNLLKLLHSPFGHCASFGVELIDLVQSTFDWCLKVLMDKITAAFSVMFVNLHPWSAVIGVCSGLSACFLCAGPNPVESGKLYTDGQHYISNSARPSRAHPRQVFIYEYTVKAGIVRNSVVHIHNINVRMLRLICG
ncbi:hypothetical protein OUZ56_013440 [Daphnia magna]|uniref:Uncharacterized protein n=1 Tax=Daphnia magna TaxID=35525 RepID=A0ABQ9Z5X2_9CRUS|nr:hypothetical protein OUZ56_013440 [Daphnia magna]